MRSAVLLVPLDARPCTRDYPVAIGKIGGCDVIVPPQELLGDLTRPAPCDELFAWVEGLSDQFEVAILALDTLIYGGLIPARRSPYALNVLLDRLERIRRLPIPRRYAFAITLRIANCAVADEEKPYWEDYGPSVFQWSFWADHFDQTGDDASRTRSFQARASIPDDIATDYLATRQRNFIVNEREVELAAAGEFALLCLTQDDTAPYGFNQAEKRLLERKKPASTLMYPGADEVAAVLVGRHLNDRDGRRPAFQLCCFPERSMNLVAMYEDRPFAATARGQIEAVGGELADSSIPADLDLVVNLPASGQGDLALGIHLDRVECPPRDLNALIERLQRGPAAAFADLAYANGADPALWAKVSGQMLGNLAAFAAWNTAGNSLGTVVAMASAYLTGPVDESAHRQFLVDRLADDYLYQSLLRPKLQRTNQMASRLEGTIADELRLLWHEHFPQLPIRRVRAYLPWHRLFEAAIAVEL